MSGPRGERVGLVGRRVGGAPLSAYHAAMLQIAARIADTELARDVWDEDPPTLWGIDNRRTPGTLTAGALVAWEMPVPDGDVWDGHDGADVIYQLADFIRTALAVRRTLKKPPLLEAGHVCGVAIIAETWSLNFPDTATEAERLAAQEFAARVGVADHPWAVEAKSVIAVSTDGWRYTVDRHRTTGDGPAVAEPPDGGMGGRYIDALDTLLAALRSTVDA